MNSSISKTPKATPEPIQKPHPPIWLGGFTPAALRRAARFGDGFTVPGANRDVYDRYVAELRKENRPTDNIRFASAFWCLIIFNNPEKTFAEAADHIIYQANNYSAWLAAAGLQPLSEHLRDREQLRQSGLLKVVDPDTAIRTIREFINVLEARRGYLPGNWDILWSLSVEEMFYLFFPLVARLFGRGRLFVALLLGFVVVGPFARTVFTHGNEVWKEYSYLGGMDAIALGCLTALLVKRFQFSRVVLWTLGIGGTVLLIFSLCFSLQAEAWGLSRVGLDMTVLAVGTCMVIATVAQKKWEGPRAMSPLLNLGQRSYEIYLTHMFVVFGLFQLFVVYGKPMKGVASLFVVTIVAAGLLGELVARFYSEPLNRSIRERWRGGKSVAAASLNLETTVQEASAKG